MLQSMESASTLEQAAVRQLNKIIVVEKVLGGRDCRQEMTEAQLLA